MKLGFSVRSSVIVRVMVIVIVIVIVTVIVIVITIVIIIVIEILLVDVRYAMASGLPRPSTHQILNPPP